VALGLSLYTFLENSPLKPIKTIDKPIKIAIVTPIPKPKPKVVKPAPTPPKEETIKPKPKPKKVVKKIIKKPKPKSKKITKKITKKIIKKVYKKPKPKPKKIIEKPAPIQEEFFTPEPYPQTESVETPPTPVVTQPVVQPKVDKSAKRRAFLKAVRGKIVRNKKYPPTARRRHIEGSVEVMFDIGTDGSISNIQFLNGKRILQKSVRRAILNSSPLLVPNSLQSELPIYGISVVVHFKLN
jgi:protein TonB